MRRVLLLCALLASAVDVAHAGPKDRQTAQILSGASASVSGAVVLSGFVFAQDSRPFNLPVLYTGLGMLAVTPSLGQFYAGQYLTIGMGVRAVATGFAIYTLQTRTRLAKCDFDPSSEPPRCEIFTEGAYPMLGIAAIAFIGGVWYDVLDAADAADRHNAKHGYTVMPTALRGPQGLAPGLAISGTF
jgi:hypothetical protein